MWKFIGFYLFYFNHSTYKKGVSKCANQPTNRFHADRFLYSSLVSRVLSFWSSSNISISS